MQGEKIAGVFRIYHMYSKAGDCRENDLEWSLRVEELVEKGGLEVNSKLAVKWAHDVSESYIQLEYRMVGIRRGVAGLGKKDDRQLRTHKLIFFEL